jgi:hypothetical protein
MRTSLLLLNQPLVFELHRRLLLGNLPRLLRQIPGLIDQQDETRMQMKHTVISFTSDFLGAEGFSFFFFRSFSFIDSKASATASGDS